MAQRDIYLSKFIQSHLENGNSDAADFYHDDPTTMGFSVFFHFSDIPSPLPGTTLSPLFNEDPTRESAHNYLKSIDEPQRAERLLRFKERLRRLTKETPYYFQKLTGLEGLYNFDFETPFRMNERKITIETLESIDLRVATMAARYMEAVYDWEYHREMIPENLLEFTCIIMISEIRNFRKLMTAATNDVENKFELANDKIGIHAYTFEKCVFDFSESNPFLNEVDNAGSDAATNQFSIKLGKLRETHKLNFIQLFTQGDRNDEVYNKLDRDLSSLTPIEGMNKPISTTAFGRAKEDANFLKNFYQREKDFFTDKFDLETLGNRALNDLYDNFDTKIKGFILGNIYSDFSRFRNGDLYTDTKEFVKDLALNRKTTQQAIEDFSVTRVVGAVLDQLGDINFREIPINLNEIFLGNVEGFNQAPFSSTLNHIAAGSLGNIFEGG